MSKKPPLGFISFLRKFDRSVPWFKVLCLILIGAGLLCDIWRASLSPTPVHISHYPLISDAAMRPLYVRRNLTGKKLIALTFDDGPVADVTPQLLGLLRQKAVRATFFMLGSRMAAFPDVAKQVAYDGHEIESHTMNHRNLTQLHPNDIAYEVNAAVDAQKAILGTEPWLVRPPYGAINPSVRANIRQPLMLWNIDSEDWKLRDPAQIHAKTMAQVKDSGIILMHDVYSSTVAAVGPLIDALRSQGYEFVTVKELVEHRQISLVPGYAYGNFSEL